MTEKRLIRFAKDESGAVTVDWVVLTGGIVGLALATFLLMRPETLVTAGTSIGSVAAGATAAAGASLDTPMPGGPGGSDPLPEPGQPD